MLFGKCPSDTDGLYYPYSFWEDMELRLIRIIIILKDKYRRNTLEILLF
jgi:hypothetical protein